MGISTHILDTSTGQPAVHVGVTLARAGANAVWTILEHTATDGDGRCKALLPAKEAMTPGLYAIRFETQRYYAAQGVSGLYPYIEITFTVEARQAHYHIPLLLTANGYTTYRGS